MANIIHVKFFKTFQIIIIFIITLDYTNYVATNQTNTDFNTKETVKGIIAELEKDLDILKNDEFLSIYKSSKSATKNLYHVNPHKKLEKLSNNLKLNIETINAALEKARDNFKSHNSSDLSRHKQLLVSPCEDMFNSDIGSFWTNQSSKHFDHQILNNLYSNVWSVQNYLKQVYSLSLPENGLQFQNNADSVSECYGIDYLNLWSRYMSHNVYRKRRIVLVIDHGNSIEENTLGIGKLFAKQMISALNEKDEFTVIAIALKWSSLTVTEPCGNEHLPSILSGSENNKELTYNFIDELNSKSEITDHNAGIRLAIKMARLFYAPEETVMLIFISPNIQFSMRKAIISLNDLSSPLVINICVVSSGLNQDIQDMSDVLNNFIMENGLQLISRGRLVLINGEYDIGMEVTKFYEAFSKKIHRTSTKVSLPTWDTRNQELILTFSIGFSTGNRFVVIGVDVSFVKFVRDIIYYASYQKDMYAVLMDIKGNILVHPSVLLDKQIKFGHVSNYFEEYYEDFLEKTEGTYKSPLTSHEFTWKRVENYIILVISTGEYEKSQTFQPKSSWLPNFSNNHFVTYLLNIAGDVNSCKYFTHIANFESSSLYLNEKCFKSSVKNTNNESVSLKLLPYFQHEGLLIKRDGLHEGIRDELTELVELTEMLQSKHSNSANSEYIIRRYVATKSGILYVFPGVTLDFGYEPTKRQWFVRANELKGKIITTPPYLDAGGAGYIVTISYATPTSIVLGLDVNYGFILKMILEKHSKCLGNNTCFIIDDKGYLVSYPDLVKTMAGENEPVEQLHLVHKESSVANDLLNHEELVRKLACNDYNTAKIQRYYQLNTSYSNILTSSVPYVSYSISPIDGTNLFFGVIKSTSSNTRTFCPCSVIDRICLNCNHMEKQECECPCECPIQRSSCSNYTSHDDYKLCYPFLENYSSDPIFHHDDELEQCPRVNCNVKTTHLSCLGVIGCEWCKKDIYGFPIEMPFCTASYECFNGVLGGPSPYKDVGIETNSMFTTIKNTGLVLGLVVIVALAFISVFIWRNYNTPRNHQRVYYLSARQEEHLHMNDLNVNDVYLEQGNHSDKLLIDEKKIAPISPYCVASNYSRPATAADSDHGYSTMTPHDESEHLSLAPVKIDSLEDDLASDRTTPPMRHKMLLTKIPNKNCIIVPVIVHRQIDAS